MEFGCGRLSRRAQEWFTGGAMADRRLRPPRRRWSTSDVQEARLISGQNAARVRRVVDIAEDRYPDNVELAASYVASEALTHVAKRARASTGLVATRRAEEPVVLTVAAVGGVRTPADGRLSGLADRLALDGTLTVTSKAGRRVQVCAEIPPPTGAPAAAPPQDDARGRAVVAGAIRGSSPTARSMMPHATRGAAVTRVNGRSDAWRLRQPGLLEPASGEACRDGRICPDRRR